MANSLMKKSQLEIMTDREPARASVSQLIDDISETGKYAFLIGAGSSRPKPAGILTGGELIKQWRRECYGRDEPDLNYEEWVDMKEEEMVSGQSEYGFWFEERHPSRGGRREYIRDLVEGADPTLGHIILATMMTEGYVPNTLTPNFDDLLFDAFYLFLEERPQLVNHRAVALNLGSQASVRRS